MVQERIDENYILGIHTTDMPSLNTLKVLEKRQRYLIKKVQNNLENNNDKNSHFLDEIRALEKAMNFIKWVINNASNDVVQGAIEKYRYENKYGEEETIDEETEKEKEILKGIFHEKFSNRHKLEITITEYNEAHYLCIEEIKLKQDMITWKKTARIKMSLHKMERIIKRAHEIV